MNNESSIDEVPGWVWGLCAVGLLFILTAVGFWVRGASLASDKAFLVPEANVQTEAFEHTEAFREGTRRDFAELSLAYSTEKDPDAKRAILAVIRQRANGCPADQVPSNVRSLLE